MIRRRVAAKGAVNASPVVIGMESVELPLEVDRIPEERLVVKFAPDRPDNSFHEWMRHRDMGH